MPAKDWAGPAAREEFAGATNSNATPFNSEATFSADDRHPTASDQTLVRRVRAGRDDAATELYFRYVRRLHGLARRQTSTRIAPRVEPEDIVQSVFRTFFRRVRKGDYELPGGDELWRLLLVITLNKIRRAAIHHTAQCRDIRRTSNLEQAAIEQILCGTAGQDDTALVLLQLVIDDVVRELSPAKGEMIRLRIDGHDVDSISKLTHRSRRTVERTLQEFRNTLGRLLEDDKV